MTSKLNNKECKGCILYEKNPKIDQMQCNIILNGRSHLCPCRNCIIKVTCQIGEECDKFTKFLLDE